MSGKHALPLLLGALLLAAPGARALDCAAVAPPLFPDDLPPTGRPLACVIAPWRDGPLRVVAATRDDAFAVALVAETAGAPRVVARTPPALEALTPGPLWSTTLEVVPSPLGPGSGTVAVSLANAYVSTGRSTATRALHLFRWDRDVLRPVFAGYTAAEHATAVPCRTGRADVPRCRRSWTLRRRIEPGPARPGALPDLTLRDARTGRTVSRHRWDGTAYRPPLADATPPLGAG